MEEVDKVHFLVAIVFFKIQPPWNFRGQGHLGTLAKGHTSLLCQHLQRASPMKLLGQFHFNCICSLQAKGERQFKYFV